MQEAPIISLSTPNSVELTAKCFHVIETLLNKKSFVMTSGLQTQTKHRQRERGEVRGERHAIKGGNH
jgi:hypothetical protein